MFRTIQVLLIAAIAIAMILLFRRKLHKERSLIAGLLLCLLLAAVVSNGIVELIPLPTDPVIVTATGEKMRLRPGMRRILSTTLWAEQSMKSRTPQRENGSGKGTSICGGMRTIPASPMGPPEVLQCRFPMAGTGLYSLG